MPLSLTASSITQTQSLVNNIGPSNRQMFLISGKLYFITKRQIPFLSADSFALAFGSDTTGLVWSLLGSVATGSNSPGNGSATEFAVASVGTKIYLVDFNKPSAGIGTSNFHLAVWAFDTAAGTWSGPAANGPFATNTNNLQMVALNNGSLLVIYNRAADAFGNTLAFNSVIYNPSTNTWGSATTVNATGNSQVVAAQHDPTTDRTVVFYNLGSTAQTLASTLDNTGAVLNTSTSIYTFPASFSFIDTWGQPAVTSDSNSGGSSVALPFKDASGNIQVMFVDLSTFATALELVDNGTDLGANTIGNYGSQDSAGWLALDFGGTLYTVFTADNGGLNNASSRSFLYAKNRTGGTWGGLQTLHTSVLSREPLVPYSTAWNANGPAILYNLWDPTVNIQSGSVSGLTSFILLPSGGASVTKFEIALFGTKRYTQRPQEECTEAIEPRRFKRVM